MTVTKESIRAKLEAYILDYNRKITMWKNVQLVTKKDGTEFLNFSKNFTNCKVVKNYDDINLEVSDWNTELLPRHLSDSIRTRMCVDDYKGERPSEDRIIRTPGLRPYFYLNVQETYQAIQEHIATLEMWRDRNIEDLTRLDKAYDYVEETLNEMKAKLEELAPPNGIYPSSLYYALKQKINDFPY